MDTYRLLCKKNCSEQVKSAKLKKDEMIRKYINRILIGKDERKVSYISTEFKNEVIKVSNKRNQK